MKKVLKVIIGTVLGLGILFGTANISKDSADPGGGGVGGNSVIPTPPKEV